MQYDLYYMKKISIYVDGLIFAYSKNSKSCIIWKRSKVKEA